MPWHFIPRISKLASVEMYVWNGYDEHSETVNVLEGTLHWNAELYYYYHNRRRRRCRLSFLLLFFVAFNTELTLVLDWTE